LFYEQNIVIYFVSENVVKVRCLKITFVFRQINFE